MKKRIYNAPTLNIVQLQSCDILTASAPDGAFRGEDDRFEW